MTTHSQTGRAWPSTEQRIEQWEVFDVVTVNAIVQSKENAEACLCKDRVCGFESNMIA